MADTSSNAPAGEALTRTWSRMNLVLGIILVVAGVLLDTIGLVREDVVAASGPFVMVAGLVWIVIVLVKDMPARANYLGLIALVLGAILLTHDALVPYPANYVLHLGTGVALVLVGVLHIVGRSSLLRLIQPKPAA